MVGPGIWPGTYAARLYLSKKDSEEKICCIIAFRRSALEKYLRDVSNVLDSYQTLLFSVAVRRRRLVAGNFIDHVAITCMPHKAQLPALPKYLK